MTPLDLKKLKELAGQILTLLIDQQDTQAFVALDPYLPWLLVELLSIEAESAEAHRLVGSERLRLSVLVEFTDHRLAFSDDPVWAIPGLQPSHLHSSVRPWLAVRPCLTDLHGLRKLIRSLQQPNPLIARFEICTTRDSLESSQDANRSRENRPAQPDQPDSAREAQRRYMKHHGGPQGKARPSPAPAPQPAPTPACLPPLVCVVDDLCGFASPRLKSGAMTALWHQGSDASTTNRFDDTGHWASALELPIDTPHGLPPGRWLHGQHSGALLGRKLIFDRRLMDLDEWTAYRFATYPYPAMRMSHGSAVLDTVAGGSGPMHTPAADAHKPQEVVFVQLPVPSVLDTSGGSLAAHALDGLHHAIEAAKEGQAIIANISYGSHSGPHDGTSLWDTGLSELLDRYDGSPAFERKTLHVVLPAGNSHRHRCHAFMHVCEGHPVRTLRWRVLPDDTTSSFVEIWFPEGVSARVRVRPPGDRASRFVLRGGPLELGPGWAVIFPRRVAQSRRGSMALVCVGPTVPWKAAPDIQKVLQQYKQPAATQFDETITPDKHVAAHGVWTIEVGAGSDPDSKDFQFHAWVMRGDAAPGRRQARHGNAGRQAYFLDGDDEAVDPGFTMNGIACLEHERLWVVGAMRRSDQTIATYSAAGPNRMNCARDQQSWRVLGPDVVVAADESLNQGGLVCTGLLSGTRQRMSGTSMAAASFTRKLYEHLASGQPPSTVALPEADGPSRLSPTGNPYVTDAPFVLRGECNRRTGGESSDSGQPCRPTSVPAMPAQDANVPAR